jgi:hypothetical protein
MERLILEALRVLLRAQLEQVVSDEVREALLAQVGAIRDALAVWSAMGAEAPPAGYGEPPAGVPIG